MTNVFVALFEHRNDTTVQVFSTREKAEGWRQAIAREFWYELDIPIPEDEPDVMADLYFSAKGELSPPLMESFTVRECPVE